MGITIFAASATNSAISIGLFAAHIAMMPAQISAAFNNVMVVKAWIFFGG
jgi:hypothetical protein